MYKIKKSKIRELMKDFGYDRPDRKDRYFCIFISKDKEIYGRYEECDNLIGYVSDHVLLHSFKVPKYIRTMKNEPYPEKPNKLEVMEFINSCLDNEAYFPKCSEGIDKFNNLVHAVNMWDDDKTIVELNAQFENVILDYAEWYYKQYIDSERDIDYEIEEIFSAIYFNRNKIIEDTKLLWPDFIRKMDTIKFIED